MISPLAAATRLDMTKQVNELKNQKKIGMKNRFQIFAPDVFFSYDEHTYTVHHFSPFEEVE